MVRLRALALVFAASVAVAAPAAMAAQQEFKASLEQSVIWDTNPRMIVVAHDDLYQSQTTPSLSFNSKTPTSFLDIKASATQNLANLSGYSTTDLHSSIGVGRTVEQWEASLRARGDYDTTHTSELTTLGLNVGAVRRTSFAITPSLTYKPTALDSLILSPEFSKTVYDGNAYTDFHNLSIELQYLRQFAPDWAAFIATEARRYETDEGRSRKIDSVSPTVGFITTLMPRLKLRGSLGLQAATDSLQTPSKTEWSNVFEASLTYEGQQHTLSLTGSRSQQPYVNGDEELLTSFTLRDSYKMNTLLTLSVAGSYYFGQEASRFDDNLKARWEAAPALIWRLMPEVDLTTGYKYRNETLYNRDGKADSHLARIGILWKP